MPEMSMTEKYIINMIHKMGSLYKIKIEALGASPSQPSPLTEDLN